MRLHNSNEATEGNVAQQNFSIEMNEVMFDMLSANIYTDRISSVIRELVANATDGCVMVQKPVKFDLHLPTMLEPHFSVRDYGGSMTKELVFELYSTMGASTKRNSNEAIGTLGIGAAGATRLRWQRLWTGGHGIRLN